MGGGTALVVRSIDDFIPSSGTKLVGNPKKTTTILGRWEPDMKIIIKKLIAEEFNVGTEYGIVNSNKGGFNFLNIQVPYNKETFFEQFNMPWLQKAIERGDDIVLATIPKSKHELIDFYTNKLKGNFAFELDYLIKNDYKPINISTSDWNLLKSFLKI